MIEELTQIVEVILGTTGVRPGDRLAEDLEAESMDVVNIVADVEERYGIEIDDDQLSGVRTVGDLLRVVEATRRG